MAQSALFAGISDTDYERIKHAIINGGNTIKRCENLESATNELQSSEFGLLFVDLEHMNGPTLDRLDAISRMHTNVSVFVLTDGRDKHQLSELFTRPFICHLVGKHTDRADKEITLLLTYIRGAKINLIEDELKNKTKSINCTIRSNTDKQSAVDEVTALCTSFNMNSRLINTAQGVADEFITNAVYNAPLTTDGKPRYAALNRTAPVQLTESEQAVFRVGCDARTLILEITDPFGSLNPDILRSSLARGFGSRLTPEVTQSGGAGLGFFHILTQVNRLIVDIEPGIRTTMTGVINVTRAYREFVRTPKSIHIFSR